MSAWKPTDEQVDVIAGERFREALGGDATWAIQSPAVKARFEKRVRAEIETSYIQSIIRAAQADALRWAARHMGDSTSELDPNHLLEGAYVTCTALDVRFLQDRADDLEARS